MNRQRAVPALAAAAILCLFLVSGCGGPSNAQHDPVVEAPVAESESEPETSTLNLGEAEPILPYTYPLTGLPAAERMTDRPVVVMVENSPAARPQTGLHEADIVYEVLAEGDITRFIAIYHSVKSEEIGPVRSIRPYFVELGQAVDGILVHAGWSQEAIILIAKNKLNHLDQVYGDHAYYWRDSSRKAPHNLYTSIELVRKGSEDKKFRTDWAAPVLTFQRTSAIAAAGAPKGTSVSIPYLQGYTVEYTYDPETNTYLRSMKGQAHEDKLTGERLSAANVLVVETKHRIVDKIGRRDVDVRGPGQGYIVQEGRYREMFWKLHNGVIRAYEEEKMQKEIPLLPGKTWIQIVPKLSGVTFNE